MDLTLQVISVEDTYDDAVEGGKDVLNSINSFFGGSWFALSSVSNGYGGDDLRVLVAQLTTDGNLTGLLHTQIFPNGDYDQELLLNLSFGTAGCGCTDEAACNYDADAVYEDGSCTEAVYECGCNDIPDGDCDCDGNQLDECGVCGGAGFAEGACDCDGNVEDECGVCGGSGIADGACDCDGNEELGCGCGEDAPSSMCPWALDIDVCNLHECPPDPNAVSFNIYRETPVGDLFLVQGGLTYNHYTDTGLDWEEAHTYAISYKYDSNQNGVIEEDEEYFSTIALTYDDNQNPDKAERKLAVLMLKF